MAPVVEQTLQKKGKEQEKFVRLLPKYLDEEVARLHLDKLGVHLTALTSEQADYIHRDVDGPYKGDGYTCISTKVYSTRDHR